MNEFKLAYITNKIKALGYYRYFVTNPFVSSLTFSGYSQIPGVSMISMVGTYDDLISIINSCGTTAYFLFYSSKYF